MEDCLMNLNKGEDDFGGGNILQYSEWNDMVEGINTEGLFREYCALWQQEYKSPMARIVNTFVRFQSVKPTGESGTINQIR